MDFLQFFVPNSQPSKAVQPCPGALHHPAIAPQPLAGVNSPPRNAGLYAAAAQLRAQSPGVVRLVRVQLHRAPSRSAPSLADRRNGVNTAQHQPGIVHVGAALYDREGDAVGFDHKMPLRARFAAIRWIGAGVRPTFGAGTVKESTDARLQSSRAASERCASRTWCSVRQTPARCHSRSLRQPVAPDPQPISWGNQDQGTPVRKTKMMPRRVSRFATRGRPPLG
jgi:hypothetical protein